MFLSTGYSCAAWGNTRAVRSLALELLSTADKLLQHLARDSPLTASMGAVHKGG